MATTQSSPGGWPERTEAWQSYRCPVCGHTDAVSAAELTAIRCSHCDTALEVDLSTLDRERVAVQVLKSEPEKPT